MIILGTGYGKFVSNCVCVYFFLFLYFYSLFAGFGYFTFFDCMFGDKYDIGTDFVGHFYIYMVFGSRRKRSIQYISMKKCLKRDRNCLCWESSQWKYPGAFAILKSPLLPSMYRREQDRGRRPPKRSRSPDERDRSQRDDKRRRPHANERESERSLSPRTTRSSTIQNESREERQHRRDERRERDTRPRPQGTPI